MQQPTLLGARRVAADIHEIASYLPVPGLGILPVNAFVVRGAEPMLVDTGLGMLGEPFVEALGSVVDPADIRWIWISHLDADHIGNLAAVLAQAPAARIVTSFLGMGKMMLHGLPVERVHQLEPGGKLELADRTVVALRPPYYDAPESMGWYDTRAGALFAADAFGALMQTPAEEAGAIPREVLGEGLATWSGIDAPWLGHLDARHVARTLGAIEDLDPAVILSAHLPSARGLTAELLALVAQAAGGSPGATARTSSERLPIEAEHAA